MRQQPTRCAPAAGHTAVRAGMPPAPPPAHSPRSEAQTNKGLLPCWSELSTAGRSQVGPRHTRARARRVSAVQLARGSLPPSWGPCRRAAGGRACRTHGEGCRGLEVGGCEGGEEVGGGGGGVKGVGALVYVAGHTHTRWLQGEGRRLANTLLSCVLTPHDRERETRACRNIPNPSPAELTWRVVPLPNLCCHAPPTPKPTVLPALPSQRNRPRRPLRPHAHTHKLGSAANRFGTHSGGVLRKDVAAGPGRGQRHVHAVGRWRRRGAVERDGHARQHAARWWRQDAGAAARGASRVT